MWDCRCLGRVVSSRAPLQGRVQEPGAQRARAGSPPAAQAPGELWELPPLPAPGIRLLKESRGDLAELGPT